MKKLFLLLPLAFLALTGCSNEGANDAGNSGSGDANVTENGGGNNGGGDAATGTVLAELAVDGEIPADSGWTYVGSDAEHTTPEFYSNGGIKMRFAGVGVQSGKFAAQSKVCVTINIKALNNNTKTANASELNAFNVVGLNDAGAEAAKGGITKAQVTDAGEFSVTISGTAITSVKVTMADYPVVDGTCKNVSFGGAKVTAA